MKSFLDEHFLLDTKTAQSLYHEHAKDLPIIDYHNHLPPKEIAEDKRFGNITQAWLYGDHYKWRAMRINGVAEKFCTGDGDDREKFRQWAATVPSTLRNPLYHWTHLELQRYFDVHEVLNEKSADRIYDDCSAKLATPDYSVCRLLLKMNVELLCTTDDPLDSLEHHQAISKSGFPIKVLPAFRPDRAMAVSDTSKFLDFVRGLEKVSAASISSFDGFLAALRQRHDYFHSMGCRAADHGLEYIPAAAFTPAQLNSIFSRLLQRQSLSAEEQEIFRSGMLQQFAEWNWERGWVQQFHVGALRNNNTRMLSLLGPDTGWDSIGDFSQARNLSSFLDALDKKDKLTRTVLYNLNPADNEVFATMAGNFNDGSVAGKVQWGSAWWFLDQQDGMIRQINTLSNMGLISRFIGMLTDSRSFLSFPRHEYFRRILCNLFGNEIERGELPNDLHWTGQVIRDICYHNNKRYFNW